MTVVNYWKQNPSNTLSDSYVQKEIVLWQVNHVLHLTRLQNFLKSELKSYTTKSLNCEGIIWLISYVVDPLCLACVRSLTENLLLNFEFDAKFIGTQPWTSRVLFSTEKASSDTLLSLVDIFIDISIFSKWSGITMLINLKYQILSLQVIGKIDVESIHMDIGWYHLQHCIPLPPDPPLKIRPPLWVCKTLPRPSL